MSTGKMRRAPRRDDVTRVFASRKDAERGKGEREKERDVRETRGGRAPADGLGSRL